MSSSTPGIADLEALAAEEPFVRALARSLVFDVSQVDDVVQQTWLECLRRAVPEGEHRRAWLARVVRSRAINLRRAEARRRARETSAARSESGHAADELVERAEQRRRIVEAVLQLPPIYRQAILLRYFENLPPRRIATELGVPANTVSTRIRRALETLRERLDREHGDRRGWQLALVPLAVPTGRAAAMTGAGGAATSAVMTVALPWFVVVALGLAAFTWWYASRDRGEAATPTASATGSADADPVGAPQALIGGAAAAPDAEGGSRVAVASNLAPTVTADDGLAVLRGRVVGPDGAPAAGQACRLWTFDPISGFGSALEPFGDAVDAGPRWVDAITDANGAFRFSRVSPDGMAALYVGGANATWYPLPALPSPSASLDLGTLQLAARGVVRGTVFGGDGEPIAGAEVWAADIPGAVLRVAPIDRLDPDGALLIALPENPPADAASYHEVLRRHLSANVLQAGGDATFQVLPMPGWAQRMLRELPVLRTTTDAAGRFELGGLAPGDNVLVVKAAGCANGGRTRVAVRAGEVRELGRIRLDQAEPFAVRVLDAAGVPVSGAEVRVALRPRLGLTGILFASSSQRTGADGTAAFDSLPRGDIVVAYRAGAGTPWTTAGPFSSDESVDLSLPPAARFTVIVGASGREAPAACRFRLWQGPPFGEITAAGLQPSLPVEGRLQDLGVADRAHAFRIEQLAPGLWTLAVSADGCATALRLVTVTAGDDEPVRIDLAPGGVLAVNVEDGDGGAIEGAEVFVVADADLDTGWDGSLLYAYGGVEGWDRIVRGGLRTGVDGTVRIHDVPASGGLVVVRHPARGATTVRYANVADGARVELAAPGTLAGSLTLHGTIPPRGAYQLSVSPLDALAGAPVPDVARGVTPAADGSFRLAGLSPGRWQVLIERVDANDAFDSLGGLIGAMTPSLSWGDVASHREVIEVPANDTVTVAWDADPTAAARGDEMMTVSGTVTCDGTPAAGWTLSTRVPADTWNAPESEFAVTGAGGRFLRTDVAARSFELSVTDPRRPGTAVWTRAIEPRDGDLEMEIEIELVPATLTLRVVDALGRPAADSDVAIEGRHADGGRYLCNVRTDAGGRCSTGVFRGTAGVRVVGLGGQATVDAVTIDGDVALDVRLATEGVLSGRVLSTAAITARMIAIEAADRSMFWVHSLGDGATFAFTDVPAGRYRVELHTSDGRYSAVPAELELDGTGRIDELFRIGAPIVE